MTRPRRLDNGWWIDEPVGHSKRIEGLSWKIFWIIIAGAAIIGLIVT